MKKYTFVLFILLTLGGLVACTSNPQNDNDKQISHTEKEQQTTGETTLYNNREFGFTFSLPKSWEDFKIVKRSWEGTTNDKHKSKVSESGPILLIRHPEWTEKNPRQDIPVMIFTLSQWNSLQQREFSISAAGVPPIKLGQNNKYVFLIPPRYNYTYTEGFREVENILKSEPLQPKNLTELN